MDQHRLDALTRSLTSGVSRRTALRGLGGSGLAAFGIGRLGRAAAQEATPEPGTGPDAHPNLGFPPGERSYFMFTQIASGGTWKPKEGEEGVYTLTLTDSVEQTVYFSDRPERIVGTVPTETFLTHLTFGEANPPNAALVAQTDQGEDVLVIELMNPQYDVAAGTLTYDARVLDNYAESGLQFAADKQDDLTMPESFSAASLFIDDCSDGVVNCVRCDQDSCYNGGYIEVGHVEVGCCWNITNGCSGCHDYSYVCNSQLPECQGRCDWGDLHC